MATRRIAAMAEPALLVWAREDAGYSPDQAAKKIGVKLERLEAWESGEARPTVIQLRKLARVYKRPLAVFYLTKPPKKFQAMKDFRRLSLEALGGESPPLRFEIRKVHYRRQVAIELLQLLKIEPPYNITPANLHEDPEDVARRARRSLGLTVEDQISWKSEHEALRGWRETLEATGALVFQVSGIDVTEMRGFSVSRRPLPTIAVNIKDAIHGRIFTMLHEYAHLMLNAGGLCDLDETRSSLSEEHKTEVFCNHVAGAILVPRELLLDHHVVRQHGPSLHWSMSELNTLSRSFWASREAVLRRLLIANRTSERFYKTVRRQLQEEYSARKPSEGFAPPATMAVATAGPFFTRLVLESYHRENITSRDFSEYLDIRLKHMPKIEESAMAMPE